MAQYDKITKLRKKRSKITENLAKGSQKKLKKV